MPRRHERRLHLHGRTTLDDHLDAVAAIPASAAPIAKLPSTSTQDLDGVPTWAFVAVLALFALLTTLGRARTRGNVPKP